MKPIRPSRRRQEFRFLPAVLQTSLNLFCWDQPSRHLCQRHPLFACLREPTKVYCGTGFSHRAFHCDHLPRASPRAAAWPPTGSAIPYLVAHASPAQRDTVHGYERAVFSVEWTMRRKGEDRFVMKRRRMPFAAKIKRGDPFRPADRHEIEAMVKRIAAGASTSASRAGARTRASCFSTSRPGRRRARCSTGSTAAALPVDRCRRSARLRKNGRNSDAKRWPVASISYVHLV